ncbi:hypothetical protein D0B54_00335 [Solimonas sp. K1W22B-7]|uniref:CC0125/CC1285 family lipoprotein n=1 Tax=Solimonas sp. K1W22B-7 TaxID=2303331 RepID=UPI000E3349E2|nr:hypothetical protein [Solimonas sp. K1W22B-7]AXQ27229.1 hypothetical protein D0B54_00335 [Solimonas sp. K1W22B-7]
MNLPRSLLFAATLALAACATVTPYQPQADGLGYAEQKLESNRYRIRFNGSSKTLRGTVENYLMYRAAELTLQNGYGHFLVAGRDIEAQPQRSGSSGGVSFGFGSGGSSGIGIGLGTVLGGDSPYLAQMDVLMYAGPKPASKPAAFDAREVLSNLEPMIRRPAQAK